MDYQKTTIGQSGRQFIQCEETNWDPRGFARGVKRGFLPVKPEKADEVLAELQSGELKLAFGTLNRQTNLYEMVVVEAETADEAEIEHEEEIES